MAAKPGSVLHTLAWEALWLGAYLLATCAGVLLVWELPVLGKLVALWAVAEALFYVLMRLRFHRSNAPVADLPSSLDADTLADRLLELGRLKVFDVRQFFEGWFHGAPMESMRRRNVLDFVSYGMFTRTVEELTPEQQVWAEAFLGRAEDAWGVTFAEGYNPELRLMAHLWEPLRVWHKPLISYLVMEALGLVTSAVLLATGFNRYTHGGFDYYVHRGKAAQAGRRQTPLQEMAQRSAVHIAFDRVDLQQQQQQHLNGGDGDGCATPLCSPGSDPRLSTFGSSPRVGSAGGGSVGSGGGGSGGGSAAGSGVVPIVFMHGIGVGLMPYLHLLKAIMRACPTSPIIAVEARHVSLRLCDGAKSVDEVAACCADVLGVLGYSSACFVAHSYGTFVVSRLLQRSPALVASTVLIDPVCMMICFPQLLSTFIYAEFDPRSLLTVRGWLYLIRFAVSRDVTIAESFCRKFCWRALMLWSEDLPASSVVAVGGDDDLVPGKVIQRAMEAAGKGQVVFNPSGVHGSALIDMSWQQEIVHHIRSMVRQARKEGVEREN